MTNSPSNDPGDHKTPDLPINPIVGHPFSAILRNGLHVTIWKTAFPIYDFVFLGVVPDGAIHLWSSDGFWGYREDRDLTPHPFDITDSEIPLKEASK